MNLTKGEYQSIVAKIQACAAQLGGMHAKNYELQRRGEPLFYSHDDYQSVRAELLRLAEAVRGAA